ncbi:hypothetical protein AALO_G00063610 [Alosa alosa]|uniref:EGF-like domain-containing protein n=1 Tax=Alosa alosa TaxID=278164 RepID=A0AAV6H297_9TELE|nr:hypothetical protein AALO_G00063610 [Alosa alosa]
MGPFLVSIALFLSVAVPNAAKEETCEPNPCENGGTCLTALSNEAYTCECRTGFTGLKCASNMEVAADGEDPTQAEVLRGEF